MKDILKAMRTQKLWKFDVYKKGTSLAFWLILESCEILIVSNKLDLDCQMLTDAVSYTHLTLPTILRV